MKYYDDKENEQYIQYKQELEQKHQEALNKPKKETIQVDFGKYSFADLETLVKEYHDDLTKDALDTVIRLCEDTLDDEDFNDESDPDTITQVYKNLLQYKLDLKYFNDKENPQYEKDVEINKKDIIQQYNFDEEIKGKFVTTYKKGLNKMYLEYVIESCKNEYDRYNGYTETESNTKMCELIKKNMKRYKLDLKYYFDQKNPLYVQKLKEMGKEK